MLSDLEIAGRAKLRPIAEVAASAGLSEDEIEPCGRFKAKIALDVSRRPVRGRLVLVTGMSPTPAGEGKSTVSVGLVDALALRDRRPLLCLREPSLGPVFGCKGGATGGGCSQVVPMEDINLHFTGDFHAITSAHALLAALLDNHLFHTSALDVDPLRVVWPRAVDMNDRALRSIVVGLGGKTGGVPRQDGFVITAASEVMAVLCLATDLDDLKQRLGRIVVAYDRAGSPVRARDLEAHGAMAVLLKDALRPNLVQTLAGTPALVHGGPFANIAHGCSSLVATRTALALADVVVTEAGFGADLGAEKFFDIKCRFGGLEPSAAVIVATVRALKMHGRVPRDGLTTEDVEAVRRGLPNLRGHVDAVARFGVPAVVAINRFDSDTSAELAEVKRACCGWGVIAVEVDPHSVVAEGCLELADRLGEIVDRGGARFHPLYPDEAGLLGKIETVAREVYGAEAVDLGPGVCEELGHLERIGLGRAPVCIAKTPYSFSDDPAKLGRPRGFRVTVREVAPAAGAGFVVAKTGSVLTMPGLGLSPAARGMDLVGGRVEGLF